MSYNVKALHPLYEYFQDDWQKMRDCIAGEDEIKGRGQAYLPMKSGMLAIDDINIQAKAYETYQMRAEFPELLAPTINGASGLIHTAEPEYELPEKMQYLIENATLDGKTLASFHAEITKEILTTGRYGVLPSIKENGEFYLAGYAAETIRNWDVTNGKLTYVALDETGLVRNPDTNVWDRKEKYLELKLLEGKYVTIKWNDDIQEDPIEARKPNQQAMTEVPFVFINTTTLSADPDDIPMYGLANISIRIYRMDADYTWALHLTSEPTPWASGFDNADDAKKKGNVPTGIGASVLWLLPKGAQAGFLEFSGAGIQAQAEAINSALERAIMFGVQVISEQSMAAESGASRSLRMRSQQSILRQINKMTCAGMEKALRNIAIWMGLDPKTVNVRPADDLMDYTMDPQKLTAMVSAWQSGAYSKQTLFENIKRAGMVPKERTFEEEQDLIDNETPAMGTIPPAPSLTGNQTAQGGTGGQQQQVRNSGGQ